MVTTAIKTNMIRAVVIVDIPLGKAADKLLVQVPILGVWGKILTAHLPEAASCTPRMANSKMNQPIKQAHQSSFWRTGVRLLPLLITPSFRFQTTLDEC